jgi:DNA-binding HxlR family transcriptional regulator
MWLTLTLGSFLVALLLHLVTVRLPLPISNVLRFLMVGGCVGVGLLFALVVVHGISMELFAGLMLYGFLCELYMFLFTLVISSVGVAMLMRLRHGPLSEADLTVKSNGKGMVAVRLERMEANGFVRREEGRYVPTSSARRLVRAFVAVRTLAGHELHAAAPERARSATESKS